MATRQATSFTPAIPMTQQLNYTIFNTDNGWMGILGSAKGLLCIILPQSSAPEIRQLFGDIMNHATWLPHPFQDLMERLRLYFAGHKITFPDALALSTATAFQRQVWATTRLIPYGETRNYGWVAEQAKQPKAARAVGQALRQNPLPIIVPCHRVLTSNDKLGGYSGGLEMKRRLLHLENSGSIG